MIFLLEITDAVSSGLKRRGTFQCVISVQFKSQHLWCMGGHKCIWYGQLACFERHYEWWKVNCTIVIEQHMLPSRRCSFQGRPCVFQQDNAKPQIAAITTEWLHSRRVWVLNVMQEWDEISTAKLQKLITPMFRRLQTVLKMRCYNMVNIPPSQLFWDL